MSTIHELLDTLAKWQDGASFGDNGERPNFGLSRSIHGKWEAEAYSFYDGAGDGDGDTPEAALEACVTDLRAAPSRAKEGERQSVVWALSRALSLGHDEARRRLEAVEGWSDATTGD